MKQFYLKFALIEARDNLERPEMRSTELNSCFAWTSTAYRVYVRLTLSAGLNFAWLPSGTCHVHDVLQMYVGTTRNAADLSQTSLMSANSASLSFPLSAQSAVLSLTGDGGRTGGSEAAARADLPPRRRRLVSISYGGSYRWELTL